jgi:hypothetical protein
MTLFKADNVRYDKNSEFTWDKLNESDFVEETLNQLRLLMGVEFEDYLFYIFSNHNSGRIPESLHLSTSKKKVLIYVSDELGTDPSEFSSNYYAIFKAYIGAGNFAVNVFPFPLGCVNGVPEFKLVPIAQRKFNLFFRGNLNTNRIDFYRTFSHFSQLFPPQKILSHKLYKKFLLWFQSDFRNFFQNSIIIFNKNFKGGYSLTEYGEILSESKIVLSPMGFNSSECFRLYEAMRAGCVIISEELPPVLFYHNSPIIQVSNWNDGIKIASELISDIKKMEVLQQKTLNWWESVCSEKATASYIFDKLKSIS